MLGGGAARNKTWECQLVRGFESKVQPLGTPRVLQIAVGSLGALDLFLVQGLDHRLRPGPGLELFHRIADVGADRLW
jgi:hypothetical protein